MAPADPQLAGDETEWLTLGQAATFLGVAEKTVRKWSDAGRLRTFFTPGGHRRFARHDLEALIASRPGHAEQTSAGGGGTPRAPDPTAQDRDDGPDLGGY